MPNYFLINMIRLLFQDGQSLESNVNNQVIEAIELHWHIGGGLKLPCSWHIWPKLAINGWPLNRDLRKQFPANGIMEVPPSTLPSWNIIWHKYRARKEAAFLWSIIHKVVANLRGGWQELSPLWFTIIGVSGKQILQFPTNSTKCGVTQLTSRGNSLPNKVTMVLKNLLQWCKCLFANHSNLSAVFGFPRGAVSHEASGINRLIRFSTPSLASGENPPSREALFAWPW